jgi:hypothetical protein
MNWTMVDAPITLNSYVIKVPLKHAKRSAMPPVATRLQARVPTRAFTSQSTLAKKELLAASNLAAVSAAAAAHNARVNTQVHNAAMMKHEIHNYLSSTYDRRLQVRPRNTPSKYRQDAAAILSVVECSEFQALTPLSPPLLSPPGGRGEPPRAAHRGRGHREEVHRARRHRRREERAQEGEHPSCQPVKKCESSAPPRPMTNTDSRGGATSSNARLFPFVSTSTVI